MMIKREQEILEQIARAFMDELSKEVRFDLVFSALFELDKIQKGQTTQLSKDQRAEISSEEATKVLLNRIATTEKTNNADIKAVRNILTQIIKDPEAFGLSGKIRSFFLSYVKTSITAIGDRVEEQIILAHIHQKDWSIRKVLSIQDLGTNAENAQIFVDALRMGNYAITSKFSRWVINKYSDVTLNPAQRPIGADDILPLIAYELGQTDIRAEDMASLMYLYDHTKEDDQYTASLMFSGIQISLNRQSALQKAHPKDNPSQILMRLRAEHAAFLKMDDPVGSLIQCGVPYDHATDSVNLKEHYEVNKIKAFAKRNRDSITAHLILLNIKRASPDDINTLLAIKNHIIKYINYSETHPPENSQQTYTNRLKAAEEMLEILQKGETIKDDIFPGIRAQAHIIAINKPGLRELGFLGWLHNLTDNHKPQISIETAATLKTIDLIIAPQVSELPKENPVKQISLKPPPGDELAKTHAIQYR
ncbi:hypothetical protein LEAN103870_13040 [Legionella anisa]|nr:hypothetical protein [Legionella anisa]KTC68960.1 hypothetical protein Lani_2846 [Legionella anisa]MBN5937081.1 hypothetical protein [Legionella anisa]MCW8424924.1 hypothetical protein [Legionella anisa]MCW8445956.1 hypothetical protein [Legionella anisa]UAK80091.1 hypothetical protein K8O89_03140 [Legionella anisa]